MAQQVHKCDIYKYMDTYFFPHDNSTNTTKFDINGSLDATGTGLSKNIAGNNSNLYIGWDGQQGDKFFGKIDEVSYLGRCPNAS